MNQSSSPFDKLTPQMMVIGVVVVMVMIAPKIQSWLESIPIKHRKAARLQAYRQRRRWRKADVPKLRALGVCNAAENRLRRLESASGRKSAGRGVVRHYQPPEIVLNNIADLMTQFFAPETSAPKRLDILKKTKWWPSVCEALYRGEYTEAKASGERSPADVTEHRVASRLGISPALLRKLCASVRYDIDEKLPAIRLTDFDNWQENYETIWPATAT